MFLTVPINCIEKLNNLQVDIDRAAFSEAIKRHPSSEEYYKTGYSIELIELVLWQRYCYEMENDYWTYDGGNCSKCGSSELYTKEVPGVDFADQVICKNCGTEFIRE